MSEIVDLDTRRRYRDQPHYDTGHHPGGIDDREAARRLKLRAPEKWSVAEAWEARNCKGCRASYEGGLRVVHVLSGCPSHDLKPEAA